MSKQEWQEKYNHKIDFGVEHDFNVVDFFYSLHLEKIKAIREQIAARKKEFGEDYDERSNCDSNYVNGYNQALDDVLLTIYDKGKKDIKRTLYPKGKYYK